MVPQSRSAQAGYRNRMRMTSSPRIKICGIRDPATARTAAEAGADAVGLVFAERSPRYLRFEEAAEVVAALPPFVEPVALYADVDLDFVAEIVADLSTCTVQIHGDYAPDDLRTLEGLRVIRALPFRDDSAEDELRRWDEAYRGGEVPNLAGLLVDTPDPAKHGGTGRAFDWAALRRTLDRVEPRVPIILAGGLNPENVGEAIRTVRPWAVDVSSGVEASRGVKDPQRIADFCRAVRETG